MIWTKLKVHGTVSDCGLGKVSVYTQSVTPQLGIWCQLRSHFFFHINFKLVHSNNVKQLTCIIFYSSGLQNIYTSSI